MKKLRFCLATIFCAWSIFASAQSLKPGFDAAEYKNMMHLSAQFGDSAYAAEFPVPKNYKLLYRSAVVGLDNMWELYLSDQNIAVINLRGTTANGESWLENFYAAMVPAQGTLQLAKNRTFTYNLAPHQQAAVHIGWLVGMAFLADDVQPKIDSLSQSGITNFMIVGHSQGGAIAYLLTAHLYQLRAAGKMPANTIFKTYCSAAPKPGNEYFAFHYEYLTQMGWAYNVVNAADWVPQAPFTVQTLDDFNETNPFKNADAIIKKQKFPTNIVLKHVYKKLDKPARKTQKNYEKYLGKMASKMVAKNLEGFVAPSYFSSSNYVRTGNTILLQPDAAYFLKFPESDTKIFTHHFHGAYLYLIDHEAY